MRETVVSPSHFVRGRSPRAEFSNRKEVWSSKRNASRYDLEMSIRQRRHDSCAGPDPDNIGIPRTMAGVFDGFMGRLFLESDSNNSFAGPPVGGLPAMLAAYAAGQAFCSAASTRSGVKGALRRRTPVASKIALATAPGTIRVEASPAPFGSISFCSTR